MGNGDSEQDVGFVLAWGWVLRNPASYGKAEKLSRKMPMGLKPIVALV